MSWVAVAVGGAAVVGAGASAYGSSQQAKGIKQAGQASDAASARQEDLTWEMFNRQLQENQPYRDVGLRGLAEYQSAILGGKVDYNDPSYTQLSDGEAARYRAGQVWQDIQSGKRTIYDDFWKDIQGGKEDPISRLARDPDYLASAMGGKTPILYRAPDGSITDKPPQLSAEYDYKSSPSLIPQNRAYLRAMATRGLSGSGQEASGIADLANNDYSAQLSRLAGLAGMGQNAANANAGAAAATGAGLSNIYGNQGTNRANLAIASGDNKASLYGNIGGLAMQGANTYMLSNALKGKVT
jgi:hypothetical protein